MEASFLSTIPKLTLGKVSMNPSRLGRNGLIIKRKLVIVKAEQGDNEGKSVDENMIVLKMRIKKMKVLDAKSNVQDETSPPQLVSLEWKEWEKKLFTHYHENVCEGVEMLQSYLMKTRPSVALGMLALLAMSVPFSSSVVFVNALKVAKGLLAGCHVCIDIDF